MYFNCTTLDLDKKKLTSVVGCPSWHHRWPWWNSNPWPNEHESLRNFKSIYIFDCILIQVTYWVADYWQQMKNLDSVSLHVFYLISNLFIYINHACNFFFYVMLNKPFRNLLWRKLSLRSTAKGGDSQGAPNTNSFTLRGESMKLKRVSSSAAVPTCRSRLLGGDNYTSKSDCEKPFTNWENYIVNYIVKLLPELI